MPALSTLYAASPLDLDDANRLTFSADTTQTLNRDLDNTPADFGTMIDAEFTIQYRVSSAPTDDTYDLDIRIMTAGSGAVLAGATSTPATAWVRVASNITTTTDTNAGPTAFSYVDTSAGKGTWDTAIVELQQVYSKTKQNDGVSIEVDIVSIDGNYTEAAAGIGARLININTSEPIILTAGQNLIRGGRR